MSVNISKQHRSELLREISKIEDHLLQSSPDASSKELLLFLNDLKREVQSKRYGIVFEEHREKIDEQLKSSIPYLSADSALSISSGQNVNFLIEGDNLSVLTLLQKTHLGLIDMIYIDPPYNTGNEDFLYDDRFVEPDDSYSHSKWLSFMKKRLVLARRLLSRKGFIFISIDDKEGPHLKTLCDEVFGESNYEKTDYIQVRYPDKTLKSDMRYHKEIEQVLVYRKSEDAKPFLKPEKYNYDKFVFRISTNGHGREIELGSKKVEIYKPGEYEIIKDSEGSPDGLKEVWATGTILNGNSSGRFFRDYLSGRKETDGIGVLYKVYGIGDDKFPYRFFTGPKRENATKGKYFQGVPVDKLQTGSTKVKPIPNFYDMAADFGNIRHEGGVPFNSGKKPVRLIRQYIDYFQEKDITVLDFFAGSGTTGHAVLAANNDDGGTRRFILATNNEAGICESITYKRVRNVIYGTDNSNKIICDPHPSSLKYLRVGYVPMDEDDYYGVAEELLRHTKELVELENGIDFDSDPHLAIVLTDEEYGDFMASANLEACDSVYLGHDVFQVEEYSRKLTACGVAIKTIPQYYYPEIGA